MREPGRAEKLDLALDIAFSKEQLIKNKDTRDYYESYGSAYNNANTDNEVAYWDTSAYDEEVNFTKLSQESIKAGWTPEIIQKKADEAGMNVEAILKVLGILK